MNVLEAHAHFAARPDGGLSVLPEGVDPASLGLDPCPMATACVILSGQLADCRTNSDLDEAAAHFRGLLAAGIVSDEAWAEECVEVVKAILAWGERQVSKAALN